MHTASHISPPRSVTVTLWGVIAFGVWNLARSLAIWQEPLAGLAVTPDPRWRMVWAGAWGILFVGMSVALWRKRPFTRYLLPLVLALYGLLEIAFLLLLRAQPELHPQAWQLPTLVYATAVLFSAWALNRKAALAYFQAHWPQNQAGQLSIRN